MYRFSGRSGPKFARRGARGAVAAALTSSALEVAQWGVTFTQHELDYLAGQPLGRLATLAPDGTLQNNPVTFFVDAEAGTIDIGGHRMGTSRKFGNVRAHPQVAFVVDDVVSRSPWQPRCLEIRGDAEALEDVEPPAPGFTREVIRIRPRRILSFGIDPDDPSFSRRNA
jgi:pyridoxamine 5'-phosphate oxidase family protein